LVFAKSCAITKKINVVKVADARIGAKGYPNKENTTVDKYGIVGNVVPKVNKVCFLLQTINELSLLRIMILNARTLFYAKPMIELSNNSIRE